MESKRLRLTEPDKNQIFKSLDHQAQRWYVRSDIFMHCLKYLTIQDICSGSVCVNQWWGYCSRLVLQHWTDLKINTWGKSGTTLQKHLKVALRYMTGLTSMTISDWRMLYERCYSITKPIILQNKHISQLVIDCELTSLHEISEMIVYLESSLRVLLLNHLNTAIIGWEVFAHALQRTRLTHVKIKTPNYLQLNKMDPFWEGFTRFGSTWISLHLEISDLVPLQFLRIPMSCSQIQTLILIKSVSYSPAAFYFNADGIKQLVQQCTQLRHLLLDGWFTRDVQDKEYAYGTGLPGQVYELISSLKHLSCLRLTNDHISWSCLVDMWKKMPHLHYISLQNILESEREMNSTFSGSLSSSDGFHIRGLFVRGWGCRFMYDTCQSFVKNNVDLKILDVAVYFPDHQLDDEHRNGSGPPIDFPNIVTHYDTLYKTIQQSSDSELSFVFSMINHFASKPFMRNERHY